MEWPNLSRADQIRSSISHRVCGLQGSGVVRGAGGKISELPGGVGCEIGVRHTPNRLL